MNEKFIKEHFQRGNQGLLSNIIIFNHFPCFYLHPSRIGQVCPEPLWNKLIFYKTGKKGLSDIILVEYELKDNYFYDFSKPYHLLALLPDDLFNKLLLFAGAYLNYKKIINIIEKDRLKEIKNILGSDLYNLALQKAKFVIGNMDTEFILSDNKSNFMENINITGKKITEYLFSSEPYPLTKRIELRFPIDSNLSFNNDIDEDKKNSLWILIKKILLQDVSPQWKPFLS
jgi:hypothetical protein